MHAQQRRAEERWLCQDVFNRAWAFARYTAWATGLWSMTSAHFAPYHRCNHMQSIGSLYVLSLRSSFAKFIRMYLLLRVGSGCIGWWCGRAGRLLLASGIPFVFIVAYQRHWTCAECRRNQVGTTWAAPIASTSAVDVHTRANVSVAFVICNWSSQWLAIVCYKCGVGQEWFTCWSFVDITAAAMNAKVKDCCTKISERCLSWRTRGWGITGVCTIGTYVILFT